MLALSKIEIEGTVKTTQGVIGSLIVLLDEFYQRAWVQWSLRPNLYELRYWQTRRRQVPRPTTHIPQ